MNYRVPLFALDYDEEEEQAVVATLRSKWISTGPRTAELEARFCEMLGVNHAVALANCTSALHLALAALEIGEGDEVITPSLTFVATANAIRYVHATPVFCDVESLDNLTLDVRMLQSLITDQTRAIIVMHYAGFPSRMDEIMSLARTHGLKVIEDACHAPLSEYHDKKLGTIGHIGCFSFFSNKNISVGEGGMLVTDSPEYYAKVKLLRSHGMTTLSYERAKGHSSAYDVVALGYNYRLDDIRASLANVQLDKLPGNLRERQRIRERYVRKLSSIEGVIVPFEHHEGFVSNYIFPIVLRDSDAETREGVRNELSKRGIQTSVHYPAVHRFSIYQRYCRPLPKTERAADSLITLPMYSSLSEDAVDYISDALKEVV